MTLEEKYKIIRTALLRIAFEGCQIGGDEASDIANNALKEIDGND